MTSTIKDVARLAGVGVGTASRALSGRGSVSPAALERVRQAAAQLAFRPSSIAQALSLKQSGAFGIYAPEIDSNFYSAILTRADRVLRAHGRHLIVVSGHQGADPRQEALDGVAFLQGRDCDGLIIAGNDLLLEDLLQIRRGAPHLVIINRQFPRLKSRTFGIDHELGGCLAARLLLEHGHRRLGVVEGPPSAPDNLARLRGFEAELQRHGLAAELRFPGDFSVESGAAAGRALMERVDRHRAAADRCTAVFCANDRMACGLISSLWVGGWRVPEHLAVVGYDDDDMAPFATPPLTTVHVPMGDVAEAATVWLLNECYGLNLTVRRDVRPSVAWRYSVTNGPFAPLRPDDGPAPAGRDEAPARTLQRAEGA